MIKNNREIKSLLFQTLFLAMHVSLFSTIITTTITHSCYASEPTSTTPTVNNSIYDIPLYFNSDQGKPFTLKAFEGKKTVLVMVYTSCQSACPIMMKKMKTIEAKLLKEKIIAEYVVISFDPTSDTPKKLSYFRKHMQVSKEHWTFGVGAEKDTRMLSNLINVKYSRNPEDGEIMHDNKIILLDEKGVIVNTIEGLASKPNKLY